MKIVANRKTVAVDPLEQQIMDAFSVKAKRLGIRGVVMSELAADLGISTKTLYSHFRQKDALVDRLVSRWAADVIGEDIATGERESPMEALKERALAWVGQFSEWSPAFWRDLKHDYPQHWQRYQESYQLKAKQRELLIQTILRPGTNAALAAAMMDAILAHLLKPEVCEQLDMTRKQAVAAAAELWALGVFSDEARRSKQSSKLRLTPNRAKEKT